MSFLKFWGKKGKKDDDLKRDENGLDPDLVERRRLRHSLSISRSGRFKQRKRERGQILDKPEIFNGQCEAGCGEESRSVSSSTSSTQSIHNDGPPTLPPTSGHAHSRVSANASTATCWDAGSNMATGSARLGRSVVT